MTANPLKNAAPVLNGDMPRGKDPDQVAARQRYWVEKGNDGLRAAGMDTLHWVCLNGHYFIEPRR